MDLNAFGRVSEDIRSCDLLIEYGFGLVTASIRFTVLWIENAFGRASDDIRSCVLWIEYGFGLVSASIRIRSTVLWKKYRPSV